MIRRFKAQDAAAVAAMVGRLNTEEGYPRDQAAKAGQLREAYLGPRALGLLLVADDPPRGYCTLHPFYETESATRGARMGDLYVMPAARRRGIGRALVAGAARQARAAWGAEFLWWTALPANARAQAFYAALGAEEGEAICAFALTRRAFARLAEGA